MEGVSIHHCVHVHSCSGASTLVPPSGARVPVCRVPALPMVAQVCAALMFTSCLGMLLGALGLWHAPAPTMCLCGRQSELGREFALHCQAVGVRLPGTSPRQVLYPCTDEGHRPIAFPDGEPAPGLWHGILPLAPFFALF